MNQELINKYDSEFCGNLPIHLINVVQSYGALVVIDKSSLHIIQVSENVEKVFKQSSYSLINTPINDYFRSGIPFSSIKEKIPQLLEIMDEKYMGILHAKEDMFLLEINLHPAENIQDDSFIGVYQELKQAMYTIELAQDIEETASVAAKELKKASGFDKVMVYRYDNNWNGFVIAEEKEEDMESYLNFTFPASDIPKQARALYLKNAYRFIPDRNYQPVKLYPVLNPLSQAFLDMSDCNVRGVSTVHLEYLKNMQVTASMSTRILKDGQLWGLIACHHKTAMVMNYKMTAVFELISGIISSKISYLENKEKQDLDIRLSSVYTNIVEETYRTANITGSLLNEKNNILDLFNATGAAIIHKGRLVKKGKLPDSSDIEDIVLWLNSKKDENIFYTDRISQEYDDAERFKEIASGLLAIPIDKTNDEYILLFRSEVIEVINWGGDPETRIQFEANMKTYHPRFSFRLWQEKVSGISLPWKKEEISIAENLRVFAQDFLKTGNFSNNID